MTPSTILGNNAPLYVVDGMPVQVTPGRGLDWLNPADIERIDVLETPAETFHTASAARTASSSSRRSDAGETWSPVRREPAAGIT